MRLSRLALLAGAALASPMVPAATAGAQVAPVTFELKDIAIREEDDPFWAADEPYAVVVGFRVAPNGAVRTTLVANGHNSLGWPRDDWAGEGDTHWLRRTIRYSTNVPAGPFGIAGAVVVHMEEDGFRTSNAALIGPALRDELQASLRAGDFSAVDRSAVAEVVERDIQTRLATALRDLDFEGIIHGIFEVADPDDYGGALVAAAVRGPSGLYSYAGAPPANRAELVARQRRFGLGCAAMALSYPAGDLSDIPWNARFVGHHVYNAQLCRQPS